MRIQNLPQFTAKVLINSVVTDTVCIGIEVSNPVSGGYTIYGESVLKIYHSPMLKSHLYTCIYVHMLYVSTLQ